MPTAQTPACPDTGLRRKGELTAERILDAAEALFAARGYAGTSLRDVAAAVELRIPSLYNHFPSKDALYGAVLARGIGPVLALMAELAGKPEAQRDTGAILERVVSVLRRHPNLPKLIQHESLDGGHHLTPMLRDWIAPVFGRAGEMAGTGPGAGRWSPEQIPLVIAAVYNVLVGQFTFAPLYRAMNGVDLLTDSMFEHQMRILREIVNALFPDAKE